MLLQIRHETTYHYEPAPKDLALCLRLFPQNTAQQSVVDWRVVVNDEPISPLLVTGLGEAQALWFNRRASDTVRVVAEGKVETTDQAGVLGKHSGYRAGIFLRETPLTEAGEAVAALCHDIEGENDLARMHALNAAVHALVDYKPGVTDMTTTAEETATRHVGVCQDFTHLFIAAARQMGLPARYVVGYLYNETSSEPASHAWAETFIDGLGWIGFDPVHEVCPAEHHIRMMSGFDAPDAAPIRGTMLPGSSEEMEIAVEIGPTGQSQSQSQSS